MGRHPDGMANMATERNHVNRMKNLPAATHDIVAVDADGEVMYETASAYGVRDAEYEVSQHNADHTQGTDYGHGEVHHFEHRER